MMLTKNNYRRAPAGCEIHGVDNRAGASVHRPPVIRFPDFDENRRTIIDCFQAVEGRGASKALPTLTAAHDRLRRVRNSPRHARLAEFLCHAIAALESDQPEGAKYILLAALATFGWPSDIVDGL